MTLSDRASRPLSVCLLDSAHQLQRRENRALPHPRPHGAPGRGRERGLWSVAREAEVRTLTWLETEVKGDISSSKLRTATPTRGPGSLRRAKGALGARDKARPLAQCKIKAPVGGGNRLPARTCSPPLPSALFTGLTVPRTPPGRRARPGLPLPPSPRLPQLLPRSTEAQRRSPNTGWGGRPCKNTPHGSAASKS